MLHIVYLRFQSIACALQIHAIPVAMAMAMALANKQAPTMIATLGEWPKIVRSATPADKITEPKTIRTIHPMIQQHRAISGVAT